MNQNPNISIFAQIKHLILGFTILLCSCIKEYSFELGPVQDTIPVIDSIPGLIDTSFLSGCATCSEDLEIKPSRWSFINGNSIVCGKITGAVLSPEKTGFTFFGPSDCSVDSGLIMTVYLNKGDTLNMDKVNITPGYTFFEYYDNTTYVDALQSSENYPFTLVIDSYNSTTRNAKGKFSGYAFSKDGKATFIYKGLYDIYF